MEICKWNWKLCVQEAVRLILIAIVHIKCMQRGEMFDTRYYIGEGLDAEGSSANDANYCLSRVQHFAFLVAIMLHDSAWFFHARCKQFQRTSNYELVIVHFVSKNTFLLLAVWLMTFIDSLHQRFEKFLQDGWWLLGGVLTSQKRLNLSLITVQSV